MIRKITKECIVCNTTFTKPKRYSHSQFNLRTTCSRACATKVIAEKRTGVKQSLATRKLKSSKQKLLWQDPKVRKARTDGMREALGRDDVRARHKQALAKYFNNPDNKQAVLDRIQKAIRTKFRPNKYRIRDGIAYVYTEDRQGNRTGTFTVDPDDLKKIQGYRWTTSGEGYIGSTIDGRRVSLHRFLMNPGSKQVDHINHKRADNRRSNLRLATSQQQAYNKSRGKSNTSGIKGVHYAAHAKKWRASIWAEDKRVHLGYYETKEDAALAYAEASDKYHKEFGNI